MSDEKRPPARLTRGKRLFAAGSVGLSMVAGLHGIGHFAGRTGAPDPGIEGAMRAARLDVGFGLRPSMWDAHTVLGLSFPVVLLGLALANLSVVAAAPGGGLVRRLTLLNLVIVGVLVAVHATYGILAPVFTLGAVELLFLAAVLQQRAEDSD